MDCAAAKESHSGHGRARDDHHHRHVNDYQTVDCTAAKEHITEHYFRILGSHSGHGRARDGHHHRHVDDSQTVDCTVAKEHLTEPDFKEHTTEPDLILGRHSGHGRAHHHRHVDDSQTVDCTAAKEKNSRSFTMRVYSWKI
jgi:hypothetical protein